MVPKRKLRLIEALLAIITVAFLAVSFLYFRQAPSAPQAPLRRFAYTPPVPLRVTTYNTDVSVSPNGRHIAFTTATASGNVLLIHDLDRELPREIEATEGATEPFWSPGSDFIGFAAAEVLKRVSVHGGPVVSLCETPAEVWGASWSADGEVIVFSAGMPPTLYEVPASGGSPKPLFSLEEPEGSSVGPTGAIYRPHFLSSEAGRRVLVFAFGTRKAPTMMVQDLETGRRELLGPGALPWYSPSGHIVYQASGLTYDLWALPFSLDTLKVTGRAFTVSRNSRDPTVAADGTLVYVDGYGAQQLRLAWFNRGGEKTGEIGQAQTAIRYPELSPDGRLVAVNAGEAWNFQDVWVYEIRSGLRTRLSSAPESYSTVFSSVWSPGGEEVVFTVNRRTTFFRKVDGSGEAEEVLTTPLRHIVSDWSRDGKYLLYELLDSETGLDLWYLERNEDGSGWQPHLFLKTSFNEAGAKFSPDGRYVAHVSNESGSQEVYVRPFPEGDRKWPVSSQGGQLPRWRPDGGELFYIEGSTLVAVPVSTSPDFSMSSAARLFEHRSLSDWAHPGYDVSADGQRFILAEPVGEAPRPAIHVVQNWFAEFRDRQQESTQ